MKLDVSSLQNMLLLSSAFNSSVFLSNSVYFSLSPQKGRFPKKDVAFHLYQATYL